MRITGTRALDVADRCGLTLNKKKDPVEEARKGISLEEAREIAEEDPSLLWVDVPDLVGGVALMGYDRGGQSTSRVIVGQTEISQSVFDGTVILGGALHNAFRCGHGTYFFQKV